MHFLFFEHLRTAQESLRHTRMRTLLTVSGVAIGVASITAILALGSGIANIVNSQVEALGDHLAVVRPVTKDSNLIELGNPTPPTTFTTSPLEERDVETISLLKDVELATPLMTLSGAVKSKDEQPSNASILATTPGFEKTTNLPMLAGQFIDTKTNEKAAVLGVQLSLELFGYEDSTGKNFTIRGQEFTVVGVVERQNNPINFNNIDIDRTAIIGFDSGKLFNGGVAQVQQINVLAKDGTNMKNLQSTINDRIARNHSGEDDTAVLVGTEIAEPTSKLFTLIRGSMAAIAGISLVVGGIGIMNIMLVSVAERTREIGLRKAVGASNASIVTQFMIESLIIGLIGGVLGYVSGYALAFFISLLLPYDPVLSWQIAAIAAALAAGTGTLFGIYPAIRASRKNPIESLRRMH